MAGLKHVVLLIESSRAYGRGLLRGISRFLRAHGSWSVFLRPRGLDDPAPPWLRKWQGDGILARIGERGMAAAVQRTQRPVVDLCGVLTGLRFPFIGVDNRAVARLAADHLLERGLDHFGFCGLPRGQHPHMDERCDEFRLWLAAARWSSPPAATRAWRCPKTWPLSASMMMSCCAPCPRRR